MIEKLQTTVFGEDQMSLISGPPSRLEMIHKINEIIDVVNQLSNKYQNENITINENDNFSNYRKCPICGHDLLDSIICTNPPIPKKDCINCGWSLTGKRENRLKYPVNESNACALDITLFNDNDGGNK